MGRPSVKSLQFDTRFSSIFRHPWHLLYLLPLNGLPLHLLRGFECPDEAAAEAVEMLEENLEERGGEDLHHHFARQFVPEIGDRVEIGDEGGE